MSDEAGQFYPAAITYPFFIAGVVAGDSNPAFATEAGGEQESLETTEEEITVVMVGDLYLSSWLEPLLLKNPAYPYADPGVRELLDQADLVLGNLEAPLSQRGKVYVEKNSPSVATRGWWRL